MATSLRVLFVEDNEADAELMLRELRRGGFDVQEMHAKEERTYVASLSKDLDIILCDYHLPNFSQEHALQLLKQRGLDVPLIVISNAYNEDRSIKAIQGGAYDWILKDRFDRLVPTIQAALQQRRVRQQKQQADHRNA